MNNLENILPFVLAWQTSSATTGSGKPAQVFKWITVVPPEVFQTHPTFKNCSWRAYCPMREHGVHDADFLTLVAEQGVLGAIFLVLLSSGAEFGIGQFPAFAKDLAMNGIIEFGDDEFGLGTGVYPRSGFKPEEEE